MFQRLSQYRQRKRETARRRRELQAGLLRIRNEADSDSGYDYATDAMAYVRTCRAGDLPASSSSYLDSVRESVERADRTAASRREDYASGHFAHSLP